MHCSIQSKSIILTQAEAKNMRPSPIIPPKRNSILSPDLCSTIHIFPSPSDNLSKLISDLISHLRHCKIPFSFHRESGQLDSLIAASQSSTTAQKVLVLIELRLVSNDKLWGTVFSKDYKFPISVHKISLRLINEESIELSSQLADKQLRSISEAIDFCEKIRCKHHSHKVQLRSVRSFRSQQKALHSYSSAKFLGKSVIQGPAKGGCNYENIFIYVDSVLNSCSNIHYEELLSSLKYQQKANTFSSFQDLQRLCSAQNKKYLLVTYSNSILDDIKRLKLNNTDLIIFGDLSPCFSYADPRVQLATNDHGLVLNFLKALGFDCAAPSKVEHQLKLIKKCSMSSTDFKNIMKKIMRDDSSFTSSNNVFRSTFRSEAMTGSGWVSNAKTETAWSPKITRHWKVDKDSFYPDRFITEEISDGNKEIEGGWNIHKTVPKVKAVINSNNAPPGETYGKQQVDYHPKPQHLHLSPTMQQNFSANFQKEHFNSTEPEIFHTERKEVIFGPLSSARQSLTVSQRPETFFSCSSRQQLRAEHLPLIRPMFSYSPAKKNLDTSSNVIQEVSEEYQPSKKSSVVNLEAEMSSRTFRNQLQAFTQSNYLQRKGSREKLEENNCAKFSANNLYSSNSNSQNQAPYRVNQKVDASPQASHKPSDENRMSFSKTPKIIKKACTIIPQEFGPSDYFPDDQINSTKKGTERASFPTQFGQNLQITKGFKQEGSQEQGKSSKAASEAQGSPTMKRKQEVSPVMIRNMQRQLPTNASTQKKKVLSPKSNKDILGNRTLDTSKKNTDVLSKPLAQQRKLSNQKQVIPTAFQNTYAKHFEGFQRIQKNGVVIYKRKGTETQSQAGKGLHIPAKIVKTIEIQREQPFSDYPQNYPIPQNDSKQRNLLAAHINRTKGTSSNQNTFKEANGSEKMLKDAALVQKALSPSSLSPNAVIARPQVNKKEVVSPRIYPNESMLSKVSQLHSDGSILRFNNIRFGVKLREKIPQHSYIVQQSKLKSVISKPFDCNRKKGLTRVVLGQEHLQEERNKLLHINTKLNNFHYILHEEFSYLQPIIKKYLASPQDKIDSFSNLESMFECLRPEKTQELFDAGFIFTIKSHLPLINPKILPDDYFIVVIEKSKNGLPVLEISDQAHRIRIDQLKWISLAQKMIIGEKLFQYVVFRSPKKEIGLLTDKFKSSEFIVERVESEFTSEVIDFYYCELPRLTRLYLFCQREQLPELLRLITIYKEFNPSFFPESCKLICVISNILNNDELILQHPAVTFINNPEDISSHVDILRYVHYNDESTFHDNLALDRFFYHQKHTTIEQKMELAFPGRFEMLPYSKLSEVYGKLEKGKGAIRKNYLLMGQSVGEKLMSDYFQKVFMLGKGKSIQSSMIRVLNLEELIELLRY